MGKYYNETVDAKTFNELRYKRQWSFTMPIRKRYESFIPPQAFALGEDLILIVEGPKVIRFRKRWSFQSVKRDIRLIYIVNDEENGPYFKIHLV